MTINPRPRLNKMLSPTRIAHLLLRRLSRPKPQYAQIGRTRLRLSANSQWPNYRKQFQLYDTALGQIASVLRSKYPPLHAIDIGANVGDTAALIRESDDIPVLCIEGDATLFPILTENVARLGPDVEIEWSFVGVDGEAVDISLGNDLGRNACLVNALSSTGSIRLRSLSSILRDHPDFQSAKLLKVDTEGFDFDIINMSADFIRKSRPVIYFEYDPHFHPEKRGAGLDTISLLASCGYSDFIYYDNFGNFLLHSKAEATSVFSDLDSYLASNRKHGTAVFYFDICALHEEDKDLVSEIRFHTQEEALQYESEVLR